jgi:hypothetical protein
MINTNNVINDFRSNSAFKTDSEVALFRQLAKSILKNSSGMFIDETHGTVAKVEFTSPITSIERCEISDLLLIIKHMHTGEIRATFWQVKKEKHPRWPIANSDANFDFQGQFNQWELLSLRPAIVGKSRFLPPPGLLKNASSPSIGSFGVFYELNGNIEVNYSVAEAVASSGISKHPRMVINNHLTKYFYANQEAIVRKNMKSFLEAINDFTVGALLKPTNPADTWLAGYLNNKCSARGKPPFISDDWFSEPTPENDNNLDKDGDGDGDGDGISVLMIEIEN